MDREAAITELAALLQRQHHPTPAAILDVIEPYIRRRQGDALYWAAEQHQRISAAKLRHWAGLLAEGGCAIQPWAEIGPPIDTTEEKTPC